MSARKALNLLLNTTVWHGFEDPMTRNTHFRAEINSDVAGYPFNATFDIKTSYLTETAELTLYIYAKGEQKRYHDIIQREDPDYARASIKGMLFTILDKIFPPYTQKPKKKTDKSEGKGERDAAKSPVD